MYPQEGKAKGHFRLSPHQTMRMRDKLALKLIFSYIPELSYSLGLIGDSPMIIALSPTHPLISKLGTMAHFHSPYAVVSHASLPIWVPECLNKQCWHFDIWNEVWVWKCLWCSKVLEGDSFMDLVNRAYVRENPYTRGKI